MTIRTFLNFLIFYLAYVDAASKKSSKDAQEQKYIVYPGLDVDNVAIAGWLNGYSSPWNVFFGNQPYVVGWVGEDDADYGVDPGDYVEDEYQSEVVSPVADAPYDPVTEDRRRNNEKGKIPLPHT